MTVSVRRIACPTGIRTFLAPDLSFLQLPSSSRPSEGHGSLDALERKGGSGGAELDSASMAGGSARGLAYPIWNAAAPIVRDPTGSTRRRLGTRRLRRGRVPVMDPPRLPCATGTERRAEQSRS